MPFTNPVAEPLQKIQMMLKEELFRAFNVNFDQVKEVLFTREHPGDVRGGKVEILLAATYGKYIGMDGILMLLELDC